MEYFIVENGKQAGPFSIAQLAEKHIKPETLVWKEGMADWTPAWKIAELKYIRRRQSANRNCCASCSSYSQSGGRDESACSRNRGK